ncbi:MAG: Gfo/Idh/MocA family oxidoreductase [Limisphaerales bacterium]
MNDSQVSPKNNNRRDFLKTTGGITAAGALTGVTLPQVHAASDDTVKIGLIGCGGRGTGAVKNALSLSAAFGPIKLVGMADVFQGHIDNRYKTLERRFKDKMDVPPERRFVSFDGYKNVIDSVGKGGVAIFTTPCAFRRVHYKYAIERGVNVFMEKPVCADAPSGREILELNKEAKKKNLKVGVGLMVRHCRGRRELWNRIQDGQIGDILMMRAYRMAGKIASFSTKYQQETEYKDMSETLYQIKRFHSFLWLSGGAFSDYNIHQIDETSWMKNDWPVEVHATGGRHYKTDIKDGKEWADQNFDSYSVEYTYPDGTKLFFDGRNTMGCTNDFASYVHGTKGSGIVSMASHTPGKVRIFKDQHVSKNTRATNVTWAYPQPEANPYDLEWEDLINAIRNNEPYNEVDRGVRASMVTSMGRFAAHTGKKITWDDYKDNNFAMSPNADKLTLDGPSPLQLDPDGRYPKPNPGIFSKAEYTPKRKV